MNSSKVAVVVLNYKGIDDTLACITGLSKQSFSNFKIVVIENGSNDDSQEKLKDYKRHHADKLQLIFNEKNLGFDGGVNTGIRWALRHEYDYVALLNNDAIPDRDWLTNLMIAMQEKRSGIVTSLLLHEHGDTIDSTGDWYSKWGLPFPRNRGNKTAKAPESEEVFGASGGASLYSCDMLRHIGLFDEDFFAYYEDNDISFRAQLAGWKIWYEKSAVAYHKQGATSNRISSGFAVYQTFKNLPLVYIKNVPTSLLIPIGIRFYTAYILMLGHAIIKGRGWPALKGAAVGFILWFKKLPERWHIQRHKKVSVAYIKSILWDDLPPDQTGLRNLRAKLTRHTRAR